MRTYVKNVVGNMPLLNRNLWDSGCPLLSFGGGLAGALTNMKKKIMLCFIVIVLLASMFSGCIEEKPPESNWDQSQFGAQKFDQKYPTKPMKDR